MTDVMRSVYRTIRWLIMASLAFCFGLAGFFPQMMVLAESGVRVSVPPSPTTCCYRTEDGRCCGKGCCVARQPPAKEQCPTPNPNNLRDGQNNPLAMALANAVLGESDEVGSAGNRHPRSHLVRSFVPSSLQAKHVRIEFGVVGYDPPVRSQSGWQTRPTLVRPTRESATFRGD